MPGDSRGRAGRAAHLRLTPALSMGRKFQKGPCSLPGAVGSGSRPSHPSAAAPRCRQQDPVAVPPPRCSGHRSGSRSPRSARVPSTPHLSPPGVGTRLENRRRCAARRARLQTAGRSYGSERHRSASLPAGASLGNQGRILWASPLTQHGRVPVASEPVPADLPAASATRAGDNGLPRALPTCAGARAHRHCRSTQALRSLPPWRLQTQVRRPGPAGR